MMRSMFSAISGLRAHQTWMDVIGNNIANVNTTGFKVGRVRFQDILSQTVKGAGSPVDQRGGTNPMQIGLGVVTGAIDTIHTQGALQSTNRLSDIAVQGEGFFIVSDGVQTLYTRDGAFDLDVEGTLVNSSNGLHVLGWTADDLGIVDPTGPIGPITIMLGQALDATPTTQVAVTGNINATSAVNDTFETDVQIVDSLGVTHTVTLTFEKTNTNEWSYTYSIPPVTPPATSDISITAGASGTLVFTATGSLDTAASTFADLQFTFTNGADDITITNGGDFDLMTQLAGSNTANGLADGSEGGSLTSFAIGQDGTILGVYSNGTTKALGQIATATFANPGGLMKMGTNMFSPSANSGDAGVGVPGTGGRGTLANGYLEMSNVDLAEQFTSMIMAERGFQANSRVITTSDEVLQDLVNLKR